MKIVAAAPRINTQNGHQTSSDNVQQTEPTKPPTKRETFLLAMYKAGGNGLIQLEASHLYGETCLHSSISWASNDKGLLFSRVTEERINRVRTKVRFTRYSLANEAEAAKALAIINAYRAAREASLCQP